MSAFNLAAFQEAQFEGSNDTRAPLIDEGEYTAVIKGPFNDDKATRLRTTDKGQVLLDVVYEVDDAAMLAKLGVTKLPSVRQSVFLDVTEQGGLDMGPFKNAALGRLREALNLNAPGQRWGFADFIGQAVRIKLTHRPDKTNTDRVYMDVKEVTKL